MSSSSNLKILRNILISPKKYLTKYKSKIAPIISDDNIENNVDIIHMRPKNIIIPNDNIENNVDIAHMRPKNIIIPDDNIVSVKITPTESIKSTAPGPKKKRKLGYFFGLKFHDHMN